MLSEVATVGEADFDDGGQSGMQWTCQGWLVKQGNIINNKKFQETASSKNLFEWSSEILYNNYIFSKKVRNSKHKKISEIRFSSSWKQ